MVGSEQAGRKLPSEIFVCSTHVTSKVGEIAGMEFRLNWQWVKVWAVAGGGGLLVWDRGSGTVV
jgi:hypothetical protein